MDELTEYLINAPTYYYSVIRLERILNKKIIITPNHIKYVKQGPIINIFKKYGYVFTEDDYMYLMLNINNAFSNIPDNEKTNKLCVFAVQQNGQNLQFVPPNKITDEICKIAVQQNYNALEYVPENKKIYELCNIAVQQNGNALRHVPNDNKTYELCKISVQLAGKALQYVPEDKKTIEICRTAVSRNIDSLHFVPKDIYSEMKNN